MLLSSCLIICLFSVYLKFYPSLHGPSLWITSVSQISPKMIFFQHLYYTILMIFDSVTTSAVQAYGSVSNRLAYQLKISGRKIKLCHLSPVAHGKL